MPELCKKKIYKPAGGKNIFLTEGKAQTATRISHLQNQKLEQ